MEPDLSRAPRRGLGPGVLAAMAAWSAVRTRSRLLCTIGKRVSSPGELTLFPMVQSSLERVRTALQAAIAARTPGPRPLLGALDRSGSIYSTIETLGAATDLNEIRQYAVVPEGVDALID